MNNFKVALALATALVGCSSGSSSLSLPSVGQDMLASGSLLISKPVPPPQFTSPISAMGFLPTGISEQNACRVDLKEKLLTLVSSGVDPIRSSIEIDSKVSSGQYSVLLKLENPLWYATDAYFTSRRLEVPEPGDRLRFLKGALGPQAIFLSDGVILHSSPFGTKDVGGISLNSDKMAQFYKVLRVGDRLAVD